MSSGSSPRQIGAGVAARRRQVMGAIRGTEIFPIACPDISRDIANFAKR